MYAIRSGLPRYTLSGSDRIIGVNGGPFLALVLPHLGLDNREMSNDQIERHPFQFSLRTLLMTVTLFVVGVACVKLLLVFLPPPLVFAPLLVLSLFGTKLFLLHNFTKVIASLLFVTLVAASIPLLWALSPDWNNPHVLPIANYVGTPIEILTIPVVSFVIDVASCAKPRVSARTVVELLVGVPAWFFFWLFLELLLLNWIWI